MRKILIEIFASIAVLGFASSAQAAMLFEVDPNPGGTALKIVDGKDLASSFGTVIMTDDVAISVSGNADFSNGDSTIKPVKNGLLTSLTFTPTNPNEFDSFSFRGQDLVAGQVIDVIIQDNQGNAPQTITFTEANADQDFPRQGIIAAISGETIKSIELVDSGGFKMAKEFEFDVAAAAIPEPGTWLLMIAGFGLLGASLRRKETSPVKA